MEDACSRRPHICAECGNEAESLCDGNYFYGDTSVENNLCTSCNSCIYCHNDSFRSCERCNRERCGSNAEDFIECHECGSCYRCGCLCEPEEETNNGNIKDYSTNVVYALGATVPKDVRTYGIEIEVEAESEGQRALIADAVANLPALYKDWVCKYDGSLSGTRGVEIVSRPMQLDEMRESIHKLFEQAKITERVKRSESCGTHIHVGRSSVTARTIARAWAPWAYSNRSQEMKNVLLALAGRGSNTWAEWRCQSPVSLKSNKYTNARAGEPRMGGHYAAISTSSHYETYEWRMFSGCTREITAVRYVETVDCLLNIAEEAHGLEVCFKPEVLLREIGKRIDQYPALRETYSDPRKRLGKFFDTIDSARKGVPRKMKIRSIKAGRDVPTGAVAVSEPEKGGPWKSGPREAFARLDQIAMPPPKGIYIEKGISDSQKFYDVAALGPSFYPLMEAMGAVVTDEMVQAEVERNNGFPVTCDCSMCQNYLRTTRERLQLQMIEDLAEVERRQRVDHGSIWLEHPLGHQDSMCGLSEGRTVGCAAIRQRCLQSLVELRRGLLWPESGPQIEHIWYAHDFPSVSRGVPTW